MNPRLKSVLTSILMTLMSVAATWAVSHGIIPAQDQASAENIGVSILLAAATGLTWWYKQRQFAPGVMVQTINKADLAQVIQAINRADNGVKVVPEGSPTAEVNKPLK